MLEQKELSLSTLNGGALEDLFNEEFKKVLGNINDLNAEADTPREICIKIKIQPSKDRLTAETLVQVSSKLAPHKPIAGTTFFAFENNKHKAYTQNPKQMTFGDIV